MNDTIPPNPLTSRALSRLRKLAEGNGLDPAKIELVATEEKVYEIEGFTQLTPYCDIQPTQYQGPVRGKDRKVLPNFGALQAEVERIRQEFYEKRDWLPAALNELKAAPGEGWGFDGAKLSLPGKSVILAANEACPACQGRKIFTCTQCNGERTVICTYCRGTGLEMCYTCGGQGTNPAQPNQPCPTCQGKRQIPCRFCRSSGRLTCPTCQGKGGTTCTTCNGAGIITQEVAISCGAEIHFSIKGGSWPVGVRRGLDRLGIVNLAKGHADIVRVPDTPPKEDDEGDEDPHAPKAPSPMVKYRADLPYAELRLRFGGGRVAVAAVFGKRGLMMGVPSFLDESLKPWRDKLKQAALGKFPLEKTLDARAMRDAFALTIGGRGKPENLRKIYPLGLSPKTMQEILEDMRRALAQLTLHVRLGAAAGAGILSTALLAGFMLLPMHANIAQGAPWPVGLTIDLAALAIVMMLSWLALGKSVQFKLQRQFPKLKISLHSHAGMIGKIMLAGIFVGWIGALLLAPAKSAWFVYLASAIFR